MLSSKRGTSSLTLNRRTYPQHVFFTYNGVGVGDFYGTFLGSGSSKAFGDIVGIAFLMSISRSSS